MANEYLKPAFMIIGERKCGTSSLYRYLISHPQILPCKIKEPQFFSRSWLYRQRNWKKYLALFPLRDSEDPAELTWYNLKADGTIAESTVYIDRIPGVELITGEASANTFAQVPPRRLYRRLPEIKLILLLRDPVERAFSHYRMLARFHNEGRRIPFTPTNFTSDAMQEIQAIRTGKGKSYFVGLGIYIWPLRKWLDTYPKAQMMIIRTGELDTYDSCDAVMQNLYHFLDVSTQALAPGAYMRSNEAPELSVPREAHTRLAEFYHPYNQELEAFLGKSMGWNG